MSHGVKIYKGNRWIELAGSGGYTQFHSEVEFYTNIGLNTVVNIQKNLIFHECDWWDPSNLVWKPTSFTVTLTDNGNGTTTVSSVVLPGNVHRLKVIFRKFIMTAEFSNYGIILADATASLNLSGIIKPLYYSGTATVTVNTLLDAHSNLMFALSLATHYVLLPVASYPNRPTVFISPPVYPDGCIIVEQGDGSNILAQANGYWIYHLNVTPGYTPIVHVFSDNVVADNTTYGMLVYGPSGPAGGALYDSRLGAYLHLKSANNLITQSITQAISNWTGITIQDTGQALSSNQLFRPVVNQFGDTYQFNSKYVYYDNTFSPVASLYNGQIRLTYRFLKKVFAPNEPEGYFPACNYYALTGNEQNEF
jgi:hypothetical protein